MLADRDPCLSVGYRWQRASGPLSLDHSARCWRWNFELADRLDRKRHSNLHPSIPLLLDGCENLRDMVGLIVGLLVRHLQDADWFSVSIHTSLSRIVWHMDRSQSASCQ